MTAVGEALAPEQRGHLIQQRAMQAARAEWKRLQRGTATLSYTLTKSRPELIPDQTYSLTGIKAEIAAIVWLGGNIRHSFTPNAFSTSLDLESQLPDGDDIAGLANENAGYTGVLAWYRDANTGQQHKLTEGDTLAASLTPTRARPARNGRLSVSLKDWRAAPLLYSASKSHHD